MIIFTKQGDKSGMPLLFAYSKGVYVFQFYGEKEYIDIYDNSSWFWVGIDNSIDEILGVIQNGVPLFNTVSINDCIALDGSWFWDDSNGYLYVHWNDSYGDWSIYRETAVLSKISAGYASGYVYDTHNVYDGVYYEPIITQIQGLSKSVDPLELGLISFSKSSISYSNYDGRFDNITESDGVGLPIWFYGGDQNTAELTNDIRIFTGYYNGTNDNRDNIKFSIIETRLFSNNPLCQNSVDIVTYPESGEKAGELIPVAFGDIRRGIMIHINEDAADNPRTVTFLVSDPSLYSVLEISKVYDQNDNEYTISATDLNACTVTISVPVADLDNYDFDDFSWEGKGYDIDGNYNNGLDIIKSCFLDLDGVPFLESTYDVSKWNTETANNTEPVGLSVKSSKGFIEEIIEPITVSLYGVVDILGDGRISFQSRDTTALVKDIIYAVDQSKEPDLNIDPSKTVSELVVRYSRNFVNDKKDLELLYDETKDETISMYGINTRDPISPYNTVLFNLSDVENLASDIMSVNSSPDKKVSQESFRFLGLNIFDIIGIDVGRFNNETILYGEILSYEPNYLQDRENVTIRVIDNPNITTLPVTPNLISAFCIGSNSCMVKWSSVIADGYKLYYTDTPGDWYQNEITTNGSLDEDENLYYVVTGLESGGKYYFSIKSYDSIGDSLQSNIRFCSIWETGQENSYNIISNFITGLKIDMYNSESGTPPTDWVKYDDALYDDEQYEYTSSYLSGICYNPNGFKHIKLFSNTDGGLTYHQYRLSNNNVVWGSWSSLMNFSENETIYLNTNNQYMQYRLVYDPVYWFDNQYIKVKEVN